MKRPREAWRRVAVLLLIAGVRFDACFADSPRWADGEMRVTWPAALAGSMPPAGEELSTADAGLLSLTDDNVASTLWWVSQPALEVEPRTIRPAGVVGALPEAGTRPFPCTACDSWQILPAGVLYGSYIAGEKEPRMGAAFLSERDRGSIFEATIGGRLGFVRYGTPGPINPQGWQWDLEGAAMLRQDVEQELDVEAADFRIGSVITWRRGGTAVKAGYYHLSSHVGDEFLLRNPLFPRLNYVRDSLLIGVYRNLSDDLAVYGEIAYALKTDGGAEPVELQFGVEYTPYDPTRSCGAPFLAVNGHLREEFDFGGSLNVLAGWQWRGHTSNRRLRIGGQYYNGKEIQWAFFDESVQFLGGGIWFDF